VVLQGLQGGLKGRETVADIQPDLIRLEVKLKRSLHSGPEQLLPKPKNYTTGTRPSALQVLKAKTGQFTEQLRALQPQAGAAS
jgi:hypothetical protein